LAQKVRIPKIRKPASTTKTKAQKAINANGEAPATKVPKSKSPKQRGAKEKVPPAGPNETERQSTKPGKPSKLAS
jgi:hypothetical protein